MGKKLCKWDRMGKNGIKCDKIRIKWDKMG